MSEKLYAGHQAVEVIELMGWSIDRDLRQAATFQAGELIVTSA